MNVEMPRAIAAVIVSLVAVMSAVPAVAEGDTPFDDRYTRSSVRLIVE